MNVKTNEATNVADDLSKIDQGVQGELPLAVTKDRKIVVTIPQLGDFNTQTVDIQKEAISFLEAMPGLSFQYALALAKYNAGRGQHPSACS